MTIPKMDNMMTVDMCEKLSILNSAKPWLSLVVEGSKNEAKVLQKAGRISGQIATISHKNHQPQVILDRGTKNRMPEVVVTKPAT